MVEVMKIMVTSFKRSHACIAGLSASDSEAGHHQPMPPLETPGHSWASLSQSLVESVLFSPLSYCTQGFVCALQGSVTPVLCKFWQLYGGVHGDLPQKVPCTHCYTQCSQPCRGPPPTHASTGDSWTLMGKSGSVTCGVLLLPPGSWCAPGSVYAL